MSVWHHIVGASNVSVSSAISDIDSTTTLTCTVTIVDDSPDLVNANVAWTPPSGSAESPLPAMRTDDSTMFTSEYSAMISSSGDAGNYTCSVDIVANNGNTRILSPATESAVGTVYATGTASPYIHS